MMTLLKGNPRPSTRLNRGNLVLANAAQIDTRRVRARLAGFREAHRRYIEAQAAVNEAEELAAHDRSIVDRLDAAAYHSLVILSAALQINGASQRNPFGRFSPLGPGKMKLLSCPRKIAAVRELAANLRGAMGVRPAVLDAAAAAEQAVAEVETALAGWTLRCTYLSLARQSRDALGLQWDDAWRALNLLSRSVVEEPLLHAVLFAGTVRARKRAKESSATDRPGSEVEAPREEPSVVVEAPPAVGPVAVATEDPLLAVRRLLVPFGTSRDSVPSRERTRERTGKQEAGNREQGTPPGGAGSKPGLVVTRLPALPDSAPAEEDQRGCSSESSDTTELTRATKGREGSCSSSSHCLSPRTGLA